MKLYSVRRDYMPRQVYVPCRTGKKDLGHGEVVAVLMTEVLVPGCLRDQTDC